MATFIGAPAMNMLEGRISSDGGSFEAAGGGSIALDAPGEPGREVVVGIRPQHLVESDAGIDCRVRVCEPLGDETDVMLDGPGDVSITARLRVDAVPQANATMRLGPRPGTVHVFDTHSGERIETAETASVG